MNADKILTIVSLLVAILAVFVALDYWANWVIYGCLFFVLIIYFFVPDKETSELECTKVDGN